MGANVSVNKKPILQDIAQADMALPEHLMLKIKLEAAEKKRAQELESDESERKHEQTMLEIKWVGRFFAAFTGFIVIALITAHCTKDHTALNTLLPVYAGALGYIGGKKV